MRRLFIGLLLILPTLAFGQDLRRDKSGDWSLFNATTGGCIGGSSCRARSLRIPLEDKPVVAIRFRAHDQVGTKAEGVLRVKIDGNTVQGYIDIPRKGKTFTFEVDELRGRHLIFEPVNDDEVEISEIAVLYSAGRVATGRIDRRQERRSPSRGGWRSYPEVAGCIGGDECGRNGDRITIALDDAPVLGIRFYAHDAIGQRADGRLRVRIDDESINSYIDVQRAGKRHEFDVDNLYGTRLVIETSNDDEVEIKDVEVLYGARGRGSRGGQRYGGREISHEGGCIGGSQCGGSRARIRIPIYGRPVNSIRFYARDDIGTRAGGELRIRIDDEILEYALDIPREGRTFTIDGKDLEGDYLIIEPAENDEVDIKDVRVRFGDD
jgi:hypothetical protein